MVSMCPRVVLAAEEFGVVEAGVAAVGPVDDVMRIAPSDGCMASRPHASSISEIEGSA